MKDFTYETFADDLCVTIPGFHLVYKEHIEDYDQVLPHVLLGDLVRFLIAEVELHGDASAAVKPAMLLLERAMGSQDPRIQELVAVSFLENLDPGNSSFSALRTLFGPRLEEQYQRTRAERLGAPAG